MKDMLVLDGGDTIEVGQVATGHGEIQTVCVEHGITNKPVHLLIITDMDGVDLTFRFTPEGWVSVKELILNT